MFADDIITLLAAAGLGTAGTTLLIGPRPVIDVTQATLVVIPTGGLPPDGTHNSTLTPAYVRPSAQIVCRAPTYVAGESRIHQAYDTLFPIRNQFVNGVWYVYIRPAQEPFPLGEDENHLIRFVFNINCEKRHTPAVPNGAPAFDDDAFQ